jgi:hypothetical protein
MMTSQKIGLPPLEGGSIHLPVEASVVHHNNQTKTIE